MKSLFSPAHVQGLDNADVRICPAYIHPANRNPVCHGDSRYQFVRLARGARAVMLAFDHPLNTGASIFSGVEDVRAKLLSQLPHWEGDAWYIGQLDGNRYVYTLVDFDDNGWPTFNDRVPTSSLTHQYGISFEALRDLVLGVQNGIEVIA